MCSARYLILTEYSLFALALAALTWGLLNFVFLLALQPTGNIGGAVACRGQLHCPDVAVQVRHHMDDVDIPRFARDRSATHSPSWCRYFLRSRFGLSPVR